MASAYPSPSGEPAAERPPAIAIVFDHPRRHLARRAWRRFSTLTGGLLVGLGLIASIPAIPATLAVIGLVLGWLTTDPSHPDAWPSPDVPVTGILLAWAVTTTIAIGGLKYGLRLLRRHRTLVLFLRRFGHDEAQDAVTFAVLRTIGASWRMVTLDDAEMAPIGVPRGTRWLFRTGNVTSKSALAVAQFVGLRMFPRLIHLLLGVIAVALIEPALQLALTGDTSWEVWEARLAPFIEIFVAVMEWRLPFDAIGPTLPGLFALLAIAAAISFVVLLVMFGALLLAFPLGTVLFFLSSSSDSIREAEGAKRASVISRDGIYHEAREIARRSRKVFGPRLVVLCVASPHWQHAVMELAKVSSLPLIDISDPTPNVLWEVEELITRFGDRCVLIGHSERLQSFAAATAEDSTITPATRRLLHLLRGREVLAYTTDRRGLRRFSNALRKLLLSRDG